MVNQKSLSAITVVCIALLGGSVAHAESAPIRGSCVQQDTGYGLVGSGGKIDVVKLYTLAVQKFEASNLRGQASSALSKFGVTTGDPREWARLFVMVCQQESGCRIAPRYSDGSLQKFSSTLGSEKSYGPLQFNIGEYGLNSWSEVNSPSCTLDAFIRVAQQGKLFAYFGSMQHPSETMQHAGWFNKTIAPYVDGAQLTYNPDAAARDYQAVAPYVANPNGGNSGGFFGTRGLSSEGTQGLDPSGSRGGGNPGSGGEPNSQQVSQPQTASNSQQVSQPLPTPISVDILRNLPQGTADIAPAAVTKPPTFKTPSLGIVSRVRTGGSGVFLAWTSLNMDADSCRVVDQSGQVYAQSAEGGQLITTLNSAQKISLICASRGQMYRVTSAQ